MTMTQLPTPEVERSAQPAIPTLRARRSVRDRLTFNVVAGVVAGLLAFVLVTSVLRDRREMLHVAVARDRIPAGVTITAAMVDDVEMPTSVSFAPGLLTYSSATAGVVAARTVQPGEAIPSSAIGTPASTGARVMSIPVESWQAAGGELEVGDQIDVIDTGNAAPSYVLTGAAVVGRSETTIGGGLTGAARAGDLFVTVEVDDIEALALAGVIERGKLMIVRSTGAPPASQDSAPAEVADGEG